jgi:hypothetical protein
MDGSLVEFERIHHQSSCRPRTTSDMKKENQIAEVFSDYGSGLFGSIPA